MTFLHLVILATTIVQQSSTPYQLNQQAITLMAQGRNIEAMATARDAVQKAEHSLGALHPATAMFLRNLALAYEQAGFYSEAEAAATRSVSILERDFGPNDVSLTPGLNVLSESYAAEGRYSDASRAAMRAVAIGLDAGVHYATALHNAAAILEQQGLFVEAGSYYRKALVAREAMLPPGHAFTADTRAALARVEHAVQFAATH